LIEIYISIKHIKVELSSRAIERSEEILLKERPK